MFPFEMESIHQQDRVLGKYEDAGKRMTVERARRYVKQELEHDSSGHDWYHIQRATTAAVEIARVEGADEYDVRSSIG